MTSFDIWIIGFILIAAGVLVGANMLGVANEWLWVIGLVMVGLGVITGVTKTRRPDAPAASVPDTPAE